MRFLIGFILLAGCATKPYVRTHDGSCEMLASQPGNADENLDRVSELFQRSCFEEVIKLGQSIREHKRDKIYSVTSEFFEVFTPEGTLTEYVPESYERAYLTLLIAFSYLQLGNEGATQVELRRSQEESSAVLYNYGDDPVLVLLQAGLWDRFDPLVARPYWTKLAQAELFEISKLARQRLFEIDRGGARPVLWRIYGIGHFPKLNWESDFLARKKGPYKIYSEEPFPPTCSSDLGVVVSTQTWSEKIGRRYELDYHPMLFTKSLVRLPVALGYGFLGVTGGVLVGAGGCAAVIAASRSQNAQEGVWLCEASLQAGGKIIRQTTQFTEYTLKPDLRHWKKVPAAFYLTRVPSGEPEMCQAAYRVRSRTTYNLVE